MTAPRTHQEYKENIGPFVLGALPELEAELFEKHLATCEECTAEVEELRPVTAALLRSVPQVDPPPSLKASLMETVNAEAAERGGFVADAPRREKRRWRLFEGGLTPRLAMGIAACVLALGVVIGVGAERIGGGSDTTTVTAQIDRKLMPTGTATLKVSGDNGKLALKNAPAPPSGRVYQLWYQHGKMIERGGTFTPNADGSYDASVPVDSDTNAVMVTVERKGGVPAPTGPPVMQFNV